VTESVSVLCPYCGEPQPNGNDGSEQWTEEDMSRELDGLRNGLLSCCACDKPFQVCRGAAKFQ
jgi:hypothetical protein